MRMETSSSLHSLARRMSQPWCNRKNSNSAKSSPKASTTPPCALILDGLPPGALHSSKKTTDNGEGKQNQLMTSENEYDSDAQHLHTPRLTQSRSDLSDNSRKGLDKAKIAMNCPSEISNSDTNQQPTEKEDLSISEALPIAMPKPRYHSADSILGHSQHPLPPPSAVSSSYGTQSETLLVAPRREGHLRMPPRTHEERRRSGGWLTNGKRQGYGYTIINEDESWNAVNPEGLHEEKSDENRYQSPSQCSAQDIELEGSTGLSLDFGGWSRNEQSENGNRREQ